MKRLHCSGLVLWWSFFFFSAPKCFGAKKKKKANILRQKQTFIPHWLNNTKTTIFDFLNETPITRTRFWSLHWTPIFVDMYPQQDQSIEAGQAVWWSESRKPKLLLGLGSTANVQGAQSPSDHHSPTVTKITCFYLHAVKQYQLKIQFKLKLWNMRYTREISVYNISGPSA